MSSSTGAVKTRKLNVVPNSETTEPNEKETAEVNTEENAEIKQLSDDVKAARKSVKIAEQELIAAIRAKKPTAEFMAKLAETHETFDAVKKALHDAKIANHDNGKPTCSWCGKLAAKDGGFCSMKHAAAYGKAMWKDYVLGNPERFSGAMYKHVTGEEKPE